MISASAVKAAGVLYYTHAIYVPASGQKHLTLQHLLGQVGVMFDPPPITGHKAGKNGSKSKSKNV